MSEIILTDRKTQIKQNKHQINESKIKSDVFTLHTPLRDNDGISGLLWRLLLIHDRLRTGEDSPGS